jgi:hypothetical protein
MDQRNGGERVGILQGRLLFPTTRAGRLAYVWFDFPGRNKYVIGRGGARVTLARSFN